MINSTGDDLDRTTSGRFVRNLALSLSGGALVTLLGASAAQAQDAANAGTESGGTGAAQSGDATAVGNQSGTNTTQTVTVSGNLGTIQVINQQANVSNVGGAVANTGGNIAIGNSSNNTADVDQEGLSGGGPASNSGEAGNASNGSAAISTGHASAVGNQSNTTINQTAHGQAHGQLGGILVINQDALVTNSGVALANTGGNTATGNESDNDAGLVQDANSDSGIAANSGAATNGSDGKATINTGAASATGNKSDTSITQSATGSAGGALGGLVIIDQDAFVLNAGAAVANSGGNTATGNTSESDADVDQEIGDGGTDPIGVASNNGEASNWSGGTAGITTGAASAIGNDSTTTVNQDANSEITGDGGASIITQGSNVINAGFALANSGGNDATGNDSDNDANLWQDIDTAGADDVGVAGQFGLAENVSDGTGNVHSGGAHASGNRSQTDVSQTAKADGGLFNLQTQSNNVLNLGAGVANSGNNESIGNESENDADVDQETEIDPDVDTDVAVHGNFGKASNTSDGTASITTGNAVAKGNDSSTVINQEIDPDGLVIQTQVAGVANVGIAAANSGGNTAIGNDSDNNADIDEQSIEVGTDNNSVDIDAGTLVSSNNGEASNTSDGTASVSTGAAAATGNQSNTGLTQSSNGSVEGLGIVVNTQAAGVLNAGGAAVANSGGNTAIGNESDNESDIDDQDIEIGVDNDDVDITAGILTAANQGTASNASDGSASVSTGAAYATGNLSDTGVSQKADGNVDGLGGVINTQVGGVANVGIAAANSGGNLAIGNTSDNEADLDQDVEVGSDNDDDVDILAGTLTAANSGEATNASDGTASIHTGTAEATGNASSTQFAQEANGDVDGIGLVPNLQVGAVVNAGAAVANSGVNLAVGNNADNAGGDGADVEQDADVASNNDDDVELTVLGPLTASNAATSSNTSDGTAEIHTGGAQAQGNVSSTNFGQLAGGEVDGMGLPVNVQVGGVLNAGVAVANSGVNAAVGNDSENEADLDQEAEVADDNDGVTDVLVIGPLTASNSGEASNTSDGYAKVKTGGALATGNASATNFQQHQGAHTTDQGLVIGIQAGGVANVGAAVANSGVNAALGNGSDNTADSEQDANFVANEGAPTAVTVLGGVTAANQGTASNTSDGEACVCTGDAVASGNVSSTTFIQDTNLTTDGLIVLTTTGGVLNAGLGVANSGVNLALGNVSENDAEADQEVDINDALDPLVGPQVASNGGDATNTSAGTAKVASGNASGTGNLSTTDFVQAADVNAPFAVAAINGGTANVGLGLANSGLNLGVGNNSTNSATLSQSADGAGVVSNQGSAANDSDGEAIIGNPEDCEDDKVTPPGKPEEPGKPGAAGLPRTGGAIETQAAIALMLLLLGFGLKRKGQALA